MCTHLVHKLSPFCVSVAESVLLSELLDKYIHPTSSDPIVRHQLREYVTFGATVEVLMKDASQPAASQK